MIPSGKVLSGLKDRIEAAFLYGSFATGKDRPASDLDLAVIGSVTFGEVVSQLRPAQETLGREINPNYAPQKGEELKITGLLPDKDYSYVLTLTDFSGNVVTTQAQTFKTSIFESEPAQIIYEAPVTIESDQATIRLETNELLSRVMLILLPADTLIPQEFSFGSSSSLIREFTLTGLRPGIDYYYSVTIVDASGNQTQSISYGEFHTRVL